MSVSSKTIIGNQALLRLGVQPVLNFSENSKAAKFLNRVYDDILKQEQSKGFYGFTIERAILAPIVATPPFDYSYYLEIPSDCLQIVWVDPTIGEVKRESQGLAANSNVAHIRYAKLVTDTTLFSDTFVEVMVSRLALEGARYLRANDRGLITDSREAYRLALATAKYLSSVESTPEDLDADDWTNSR